MTEFNASNRKDAEETFKNAANKKKRILHVVVGNKSWVPTDKQLSEIAKLFTDANKDPTGAAVATREGVTIFEISDYDEVQAHSFKEKFDSTDIKRVSNNPAEELNNYTGPDDVALRYHFLAEDEKTDMLRVKLAAQYLINELRALGTHRDVDLAIEHVQDASMRGVRYITQSCKQ